MKCSPCQFSVLAKAAVVLVSLACSQEALLLGQEKPGDESGARTAILERLRRTCTADPLRGVLIKDGQAGEVGADKKRALKLVGFLDREEQRAILKKKAEEWLNQSQAWFDLYPGGISVDALKISPIRSKYLAALKRDFAEGNLPGGADPKDAKLLRRMMTQTRLDDAYYLYAGDDVELVVEGVCLVTDAGKKIDDVRQQLQQHIERFLQKDYAAPELSKVKVNVGKDFMHVKNPLPGFQTKFSDRAVDEIIFQDADYKPDGTLLLRGWVSQAEVDRCRKLFDEEFATDVCAAVKGKKPLFSFDEMTKKDPWPIDRKAWNKALAYSRDGDLRKTHILRVYFDVTGLDQAQLRCEVVTFSKPRGNKEDQAAADTEIRQKINVHLAEVWEKHWRDTHERFKSRMESVITPAWKIKEELQRAVISDLGVKQALIVKVLYDPDSVLMIEGVVGSEEQKNVIAQFLKDSPWAKWSGGKLTLGGLQVESWPAKIRLFQSVLANHENDLYRGTRLDSADLAYLDGGTDLALRFGGISLRAGLSDDEEKKKFRTLLIDKCVPLWPMLDEHIRGNVAPAEIKTIPPEDLDLYPQIEANPALDGVWLKKGAMTFDADGKLVLQGIWRGPKKQEKELKTLINSHFEKKAQQPNARGIVFKDLKEVATDEILEDLKRFVAKEEKEDLRPDRLYFDRDGNLKIMLGNKAARDASIKALKDELRRLIDLPGPQKGLKIASEISYPPSPFDFVGFLDEEDGEVRTLANHLREKVVLPGDPRWDGVLIERGYYNVDGVYIIKGLYDRPEQKEMLNKGLEKLKDTFEWGSSLDKGWDLQRMREMPIRPMLKAIRDVMMEYPDFDKFKLENRAYHFPNKKLALSVFSTIPKEDPDKAALDGKAARLFAKLLLAHPEWRERVEASVEDPEADAKERKERMPGVGLLVEYVPVDVKAARLAVNRALAALTDNLPDFTNDPGPGGLPTGPQFYAYNWVHWSCMPIMVAYPFTQDPKSTPTPKSVPTPKSLEKPLSREMLTKNIEYLDVAIFHQPEESATWFLRAAYHLALGNEAVAMRDLRRMNEIEMANAEATAERLKSLEYFQGELRQRTADLAIQARLQLAGGYRPASLAAVQLAAK